MALPRNVRFHESTPRKEAAAERLRPRVEAWRVLAAAGITLLVALIELLGSRFAGSLFLVSDAIHLLAHLAIFTVLLIPRRRGGDREDLLTCGILVLILFIGAALGRESMEGLLRARPAPAPALLLLSLAGLAANLLTSFLFRDPARVRWSFRAALAHELSDAALTVIALEGAGSLSSTSPGSTPRSR